MNQDTIHLLKNCNAGCKNATNSMEQVLPYITDSSLRELIHKYNDKHIDLGDECHTLLNQYCQDEKDPSMMAKAFSWISTEMKLMIDDSPQKIAGIMVDGCHMGIKSLSQDINQYAQADHKAKAITKDLIRIEEDFLKELLTFL
jgi:hypothetical protein